MFFVTDMKCRGRDGDIVTNTRVKNIEPISIDDLRLGYIDTVRKDKK